MTTRHDLSATETHGTRVHDDRSYNGVGGYRHSDHENDHYPFAPRGYAGTGGVGGGGYGDHHGGAGGYGVGRRFCDPVPLGLSAFALTLFIWSLINVRARSVDDIWLVLGVAYFYGGVVQFASGMWAFAVGNTFMGTALTSYAGFWLSWAFISTPTTGILSSYTSPSELRSAVGFFYIGWFIFTFILWIATLRTTVTYIVTFTFLTLSYLLTAISSFLNNGTVLKAGGYFGLFTSFLMWYITLSGLLTRETSYFGLPLMGLGNKRNRANRDKATVV